MNANEIIKFISESKKTTPAKVYMVGNIKDVDFSMFDEVYRGDNFVLVCDEFLKIDNFLKNNSEIIAKRIELDRKNSAIPLADLTKINSRIEPGAILRDKVTIGNNCVIMMGAVVNIGAEIGDFTMIDMNVVVGGRAIVGKKCHIGAGTVLAGVIEPPSATPVVVEDNVVIGANCVVLEGVKIGKNSVVAAGAVVTENVEENTVVAGVPAKVIKRVDKKTISKTEIVDALRNL